jgi:hypothetical protein
MLPDTLLDMDSDEAISYATILAVAATCDGDFSLEEMSAYEAAFEKARRIVAEDTKYVSLEQRQLELERQMQELYPRLFITNAQIQTTQQKARQALKADPEFNALIKMTGDLTRAQLDYRHATNPELKELWQELFQ